MFGMLKPTPAMAKQLLMGAGVDDPLVLRMVEKLLTDVRDVKTAPFFGDMMRIQEGAEALLITGQSGDEEVALLVTCTRLPKKILDGGTIP